MPDRLLHMPVEDIMNTWPETVPVFLSHRMACPGCAMAGFMTLSEAAKEYALAPEQLALELTHVIGRGPVDL